MSLFRYNRSTIELWGGVESTVNRVGNAFFDQLELNGHARRLDDLDLFAELGIRALRFPLLWERTCSAGPGAERWDWSDVGLARLTQLNVQPIVGLVHHGSGPRSTSLVDSSFPTGLAAYALEVARRYPWVDRYTPVNEPLTTARFSGLYGHWYPHGHDDVTFHRALIVQCRAIVEAMRAIRTVNPNAMLIQPEECGRVFSTSLLAYQAEFENERRWLSLDLLSGRVERGHPLWDYLRHAGVEQRELEWFLDNPCPPDIIGLNYYATSERYLDERVECYPGVRPGGNRRHAYVDVEAIRTPGIKLDGPKGLLAQAWVRYGRPVALTEVHLGATREEQLRWLADVWSAAREAKEDGVDVRAVTVWSLLGSFDWNSLVTRNAGFYESGVFDIRAPRPRPTALAGAVRDIASGRAIAHPVVASPGWWKRLERFLTSADSDETAALCEPDVFPNGAAPRPILISGATGTLGQAISRICIARGLAHCLLDRSQLDIADPRSVDRALDLHRPWAFVNAAGFVRVDDAQNERERCFRENTTGPAVLAQACAQRGIQFVTFSSDLVFDGARNKPYVESHPVNPLNVYGRSKADAERLVLAAHPAALIIRTSAFFGPWDGYNFVTCALRDLTTGRPFTAPTDAVVSPTYVPDLVDATLDLLVDGEQGIWHLANVGTLSWFDLANLVISLSGIPVSGLKGCTTAELGLPAPRPLYSVLTSERAWVMPPLEDAIARYLNEPLPRLLVRRSAAALATTLSRPM